jgi:hypothetical protein
VPNFTSAGVMVVRERGRLAGIAPVKSRTGTKGLTGGVHLPEGEQSRASGAVWLMGGAGRSAGGRRDTSGSGRDGWAESGGGETRAREGVGWNRPS